jgi:hypothetical protein
MPLPVSYCIVTRRLLIELCAVISLSLSDWFCLKKPSHTKREFLHSRHLTNNWLRNVKMAAYSTCRRKKNFQSFAVIYRKSHVASSICLRATIFQSPEWTLWTHCTFCYQHPWYHSTTECDYSELSVWLHPYIGPHTGQLTVELCRFQHQDSWDVQWIGTNT